MDMKNNRNSLNHYNEKNRKVCYLECGVMGINEQAEEILLGSILKDNSILEEITLSPEHFLDMTNQNIYKAMLSVKRKGFSD
jgi:hypothetical protein